MMRRFVLSIAVSFVAGAAAFLMQAVISPSPAAAACGAGRAEICGSDIFNEIYYYDDYHPE